MRVFFLLCAAFILHITTAKRVLDVREESRQPVLQNHTRASSSQDFCPPDFSDFEGRCFAFFLDSMTWIEAEKHCWLYGANLVSIHNLQEYEFLIDLMTQNEYFGPAWIGANDAVQFGSGLWSDGSPFEGWTPILPKGWFRWRHCFSIELHDFLRFQRQECKGELPFLCGIRPECQPA